MKKVKRGKFVVIEGGVGCGKTTQVNLLKKILKKEWKFYREPGGTEFGEKVRDAVQGLNGYDVNEYAAMFGYSASRANLIRELIIPELKKGTNIILDRYWFTSYVYQGTKVPKKIVEEVNKIATDNLMPDMVIFYDLDPKIGMERKKGKKDADRYDIKELEFHKKIRSDYKELGKKIGKKWKTINASKSVDEIQKETIKLLKRYKIIQ